MGGNPTFPVASRLGRSCPPGRGARAATPPAAAADVSGKPCSPPPQPATSHAPGRPGSSNDGPPSPRPERALERFLYADELRYLFQAYPDYRSAVRWGVFLPDPFVFTVAGPERGDIVRLLPQADDVPEGSIWDLDDPDIRVVRARSNLTTLRGLR